MIGRLKGILLEKQPPRLLLDVNGVCYEIDAPMTTFYELPEAGSAVMRVRRDKWAPFAQTRSLVIVRVSCCGIVLYGTYSNVRKGTSNL